MKIHLIHPAEILRDDAWKNLTEEEKQRAAKFRFEKDATHWAACRSELRRILAAELSISHPSEVPITESTFGKPMLAAPFDFLHFNLSHCTDLALLIVSRECPVGIDLEPLDRAHELLECESSFCHPREISKLPTEKIQRAQELLKLWTAKEAALKALGTGLSISPDLIWIDANRVFSDRLDFDFNSLTIHSLEHYVSANLYVANVCLIGDSSC